VFTRESVGGLPTELVPHFFRSLSDAMGAAIHISVSGENSHHMVEAVFKGLGRAMRPALARTGTELPSTKGAL
jgi:imidazoleglycerol phosphate dehydratase HisB